MEQQLDSLTPRQMEIARLVATGASNDDVARSLSVSPKTVEGHLGRIYTKLRLRSRTQLAAMMFRSGMLPGIIVLPDWLGAFSGAVG